MQLGGAISGWLAALHELAELICGSWGMHPSPGLAFPGSRDQDRYGEVRPNPNWPRLLESLVLQPSPAGVAFRRSTESRRQRCPGQELLQGQQAGRDSSF